MESTRPQTRSSSWPALVWTLALCILLLLPGDSFDTPSSGWLQLLPESIDKWGHALLFGGEVFWLERSLHERHPRPLLLAVALSVPLAAVTELAQSFSPGRAPSLGDFVANSLGIAACALILHFTTQRIR